MIRIARSILVVLLMLTVTRSLRAAAYAQDAGPHKTATLEVSWQDAARNRDVPIRIDFPQDLGAMDKPASIIIFSHGLGGSRDSYADYGKHWASYGYMVVFPQHHGSDTGVIGHGMATMLMGQGDLQAFKDRVDDIHFVIDQIERINAGKLDGADYAAFKDKLDLDKIGMSGHSFGAITTQAIVGQTYEVLGKAVSFADKRVKAGIAMSGSGARGEDQDAAFGSIKIPVFYLTGTEDKMGNIGSAQRRTAYDHSGGVATYLLTFNGGTHMTFVPGGFLGIAGPEKENFQKYVRQSTTAFWDAYLKGDATAKKWFEGDLKVELGTVGVFEAKGK